MEIETNQTETTKEKIIEEKENLIEEKKDLLDIIEQKQILKQEIAESIKEKKTELKELNLKARLQQVKCKNPKCNKIFDTLRKGRKYCSESCRARNNAVQQYEKLKNNEEFKKIRNEKNKKYYEINKEIIKPKMREYGMKYFFRKREEKKLESQKKEGEDGNKRSEGNSDGDNKESNS